MIGEQQTTNSGGGAGRLFFASAGRIGRGPFLVAMAVLLALFAVYDALAHGWVRTASGWAVELVLVFSACCVLSKRLHDRGRAGWWAGLVLAGFALAWPWPRGPFGWAGLVVLVAGVVDLAALPGQPGFNRHGPR